MQHIQNKKLLILISILTFLILLFCLSFIKKSDNKKTVVKTAILNPKYEISKISISNKREGNLFIENYIDFWGASYFSSTESLNTNSSGLYFPCDNQTVSDFISLCTKIEDYNIVISSKTKKELSKLDQIYSKFGLDEDNSTILTFFDIDNNVVSKLYFGSFNETQDQIFLRSEKNYSVFSINSKIADYLNLSLKFWADQNMIPKSISKNLDYSKIQNIFYNQNLKAGDSAKIKISSLRYSNLQSIHQINENPLLNVKIIDDKTTEYIYSFYSSDSGDMDYYLYSLKINPAFIYSAKAKDFINKLNAFYTISEWTFNSLTKELKQQ